MSVGRMRGEGTDGKYAAGHGWGEVRGACDSSGIIFRGQAQLKRKVCNRFLGPGRLGGAGGR